MIDTEHLVKIAKLNNLRPWQQEKHYIQTIVLVALSEYPLVFKGGTYLWFFHNLDRFSEDLDFTAAGELPRNLGEIVSESLKMFGVENSIKEINNTENSLSFRISAKGPLNTSEKDLCHVYVEISKREKVLQQSLSFKLAFDAYGLPVKIIQGMSITEVAAEKMRAVVTREKARDLYDLFFIIKYQNTSFDIKLINEKLHYYSMEFSHSLFEKKIKEKKKIWASELKGLIFGKLPEYEEVATTLMDFAKK